MVRHEAVRRSHDGKVLLVDLVRDVGLATQVLHQIQTDKLSVGASALPDTNIT